MEKVKEHQRNEIFAVTAEDILEDEHESDTPVETFSVELLTKEHDREDVKEAKQKEIDNLDNYKVYEKVKDVGQPRIGARWVVTEKEKSDGQKTKVKARLVARGFQEQDKQQSDSPTAQRDSLR